MAKYEVVVFNKSGQALGNIFHLCQNFSWTKTRNEAESVSFQLDLFEYEEYISTVGFDDEPLNFMDVGSHDIKVKRNGQWLLCTNVIKFGFADKDPSVNLAVASAGTLNYYKRRFADIDADNVAQHEILWGVIEYCNAKTGGDYGVTQGTHKGEVVLRNRHQVRKEVKSFFQQMAGVQDGCDFEFDADKKLNTYDAIGSHRPDIRLTYPGNIAKFAFERSVEKVTNYIYGVGSGNGEDAIQAEAEDATSEANVYRREQIVSYNSVVEEETLQENIDGLKHYAANPIELPTITVEDGVLDYSTVGIGDTLPINMNGSLLLSRINGFYRLESITVRVDPQGSESGDLTYDDIDIDSIIALQEADDEA